MIHEKGRVEYKYPGEIGDLGSDISQITWHCRTL